MISTYEAETRVVIFWCIEFNLQKVEWLMEWNLNDWENHSKNDIACPIGLFNLKYIQLHHLKGYDI